LSNTGLSPKVKSVRSTRERYAMALVIAGIALKPGVVVGLSQYNSSITVRFDGNRSSTCLHRDYIVSM
jgi:hypothetical protein